MLPENKPIIFDTPNEFNAITLFFAHDIHRGSELHDAEKWERFKQLVLSQPNNYVIWCGDYCEDAIVGSKGDVYSQPFSPAEQKEWFAEQLFELADRTIAIVPGNHEDRITKATGLFPVYDCALIAGLGNRYRQTYAVVDIGVGSRRHGAGSSRHLRYVGFVTHRLRDCKNYNGSDFVDGIDFAAYGHDHEPSDHARCRLVYDHYNKMVTRKDIEVIDSGSFMTYGGYAARAGYRPKSSKIFTLVLFSGRKQRMETHGFHV